MNSESKIILGLLAAAAAGAAIGVLIAPEKGSELRKKIKTQTSAWIDELAEILSAATEKVNEAYEKDENPVKEAFTPNGTNQ